jgi:hypothetical protein
LLIELSAVHLYALRYLGVVFGLVENPVGIGAAVTVVGAAETVGVIGGTGGEEKDEWAGTELSSIEDEVTRGTSILGEAKVGTTLTTGLILTSRRVIGKMESIEEEDMFL